MEYAGVYDDQGKKPWVIDMESETSETTPSAPRCGPVSTFR